MDTAAVAKATVRVLQSYLTYQAIVRIQAELRETNPTQAIWLNQYVASHSVQDGEAFLTELLNENKELVLRILTVREAIAEAVVDFIPAMVRSTLHQSTVEHRRHLLERLTQTLPDSVDRDPPFGELPPS